MAQQVVDHEERVGAQAAPFQHRADPALQRRISARQPGAAGGKEERRGEKPPHGAR
jgi:hypothetical protein